MYGTAVGVLIDLDHFLIARYRTGDWNAARFCVHNPRAALTDQRRIFDTGDVGVLSRLLSHLVLAGLLASILTFVNLSLAIVTGVVLYVHIVSDVAWDIRELGDRTEYSTNELLQTIR